MDGWDAASAAYCHHERFQEDVVVPIAELCEVLIRHAGTALTAVCVVRTEDLRRMELPTLSVVQLWASGIEPVSQIRGAS